VFYSAATVYVAFSPFTIVHSCDWPGVVNTVPLDRGKLWHLLLVVSGGVCWWRQMTTKCLWQEVSMLHKRTEQHLIARSG